MPVYVEPSIKDSLSPAAAKMLKGKSCFHCKTELLPERYEEFADLVREGVRVYRDKGWI